MLCSEAKRAGRQFVVSIGFVLCEPPMLPFSVERPIRSGNAWDVGRRSRLLVLLRPRLCSDEQHVFQVCADLRDRLSLAPEGRHCAAQHAFDMTRNLWTEMVQRWTYGRP
jgi:hypothetical protein